MDVRVDMSGLECKGEGSCVGGEHPDPPLDGFPLLVWDGLEVRTEDGAASVEEIADALAGAASITGLTRRFGTTADHVADAVIYAAAAGFLVRGK